MQPRALPREAFAPGRLVILVIAVAAPARPVFVVLAARGGGRARAGEAAAPAAAAAARGQPAAPARAAPAARLWRVLAAPPLHSACGNNISGSVLVYGCGCYALHMHALLQQAAGALLHDRAPRLSGPLWHAEKTITSLIDRNK